MHRQSVLVLLLVTGLLDTRAQEVTAYRHFNVTLNTSAPTQLAIDRGRLIWRDTDLNSGDLLFKFYSGAEIVVIDSQLIGVSGAISGDHVVWNTSGEQVKAFDIRTWTTSTLGPSYNPDYAQPIAVHNGLIAYARRKSGTGTEIVIHRFATGTDTVLSAGVWNMQPSLHHGQIAWVVSDSAAPTASANIFFFNGRTTVNLSGTAGVNNRNPVLRDGQVAWLQTGSGNPRVRLYTGDTTRTLIQSTGGSTIIAGYDLSDGIAVAAYRDTIGGSSMITIFDAASGATNLLDSSGVFSLHVSNGLVSWQSGTGPTKHLLAFDIQGASTQDLGAAEAPVMDHDVLAWTLGDAVEMARPVTYRQLTTDGMNGWTQTKMKTIDSSSVVWGNFAGGVTNMRLFVWDGVQTTQLSDSSVNQDLLMANDGYIIWRRNFDSLYYYDGTNPPVKFLDTIQAENPYVAGGSIGFFGSRTTVSETIKHIWLYEIQQARLTLLASDSGFPGNVLCWGNTACWLNGQTERLMFYDGATTTALSDSPATYDYSYRNGTIVWSERRSGVNQIMMFDVASRQKTQLTTGSVPKLYPLTDGKHVVWYEHPGYPSPSPDVVLWYYDIGTGRTVRAGRAPYSVLFWNWLSDGALGWASNGNVYTFDGQVISPMTDDNFNVNSGVYLDRGMLVWRRTPPPPAVDNGQIFTGKLHAHPAFDARNIAGSAPLVVSFTNRSWEGARSYAWDFGDGGNSTEKDPVHTYLTPGGYSVTLTVTGPAGTVTERKYRLVRVTSSTAVDDNGGELPLKAELFQNYPNPFNPETVISYQLSSTGPVSLRVVDVLGRDVETLVDGVQSAGKHKATWNARRFATGVYFVTLRAGNFIGTKKLMILR
ncbi:MAG: PKD domain-containing protein [Bacteroidota bacterium]